MQMDQGISSLRRVYRLMLLDAAGIMAFVVLMVVQSIVLLHPFGRAQEITEALMRVSSYVTWTGKVLQLVLWALMVSELTRLAEMDAWFMSARLWYLLRIIAFAVFTVTVALIPAGNMATSPVWEKLRVPAMLLVLAMEVFMEILSVALGSRRILNAGSAMLRAFGRDDAAERNAHAGRCFLVSAAAASVSCCALALVLNVGQNAYGIDLRRGLWSAQEPRALLTAMALLVLLTAGAGAVCLKDWVCSARRVKKTCVLLGELSR